MQNSFKTNTTSFEINKLITTTQLFSKIKLSVSSRLVLRCIVDYWNFKTGVAYPTQTTIAKCTGLTDVAVGYAIKQLLQQNIITVTKHRKRNYYSFTIYFFTCLNLTPKIIYGDTPKILSNIAQQSLDNNILKDNKNTAVSSLSPPVEEFSPVEFAKITISKLEGNPLFKHKVEELKNKYNL